MSNCRGIARPPIEGTSLLNPIPVPGNDSFYMETDFRVCMKYKVGA